jgi:hypothetical protein
MGWAARDDHELAVHALLDGFGHRLAVAVPGDADLLGLLDRDTSGWWRAH